MKRLLAILLAVIILLALAPAAVFAADEDAGVDFEPGINIEEGEDAPEEDALLPEEPDEPDEPDELDEPGDPDELGEPEESDEHEASFGGASLIQSADEDVCEITFGGVTTTYTTLQAAVDAVATGTANARTIKLLKNYDSSSDSYGLYINSKYITLDLNGFILNIYGRGCGLWVSTGSLLLADPYNGELNISAEGRSSFYYYSVWCQDFCKAMVSSATTTSVSGDYRGVYVGAGCELTVYGDVTVSSANTIGAQVNDSGKLTVDGEIKVPPGATYIEVAGVAKTKAQNDATSSKPGYLQYSAPYLSVVSTVWVGGGYCCEISHGGKTAKYTTVYNAINAVPDGEANARTIKMLKNYDSVGLRVENKHITLDLNGFTLSALGNSTHGLLLSYGSLRLADPYNGRFDVSTNSIFSHYGVYSIYGSKAEVSSAAATNTTGEAGGAHAASPGSNSEITVYGDVAASSASGVGAFAHGGRITVEGEINVPAGAAYIRIEADDKTKAQNDAVSTKAGYLQYSGSSQRSFVWVSNVVCEITHNAVTTRYATVQAAIDAMPSYNSNAANARTIKLLKSYNSGGLSFNSKHITLDLNGFTLNVHNPSGHGLYVSASSLLLADPYNGEFNVSTGSIYSYFGIWSVYTGRVMVSSVTCTSVSGNANGPYVSGGGELTVYGDVTVSANGVGVRAASGGKVTVEGEIKAPPGSVYIRFDGSADRTRDSYNEPSTKPGYLMYTSNLDDPNASNANTVWVRDPEATLFSEDSSSLLLTLSPDYLMLLTLGDTGKLEPLLGGEPLISPYNFEWKSSNEKVATVSSAGVVKSVGAGSCYITAAIILDEKSYSVSALIDVVDDIGRPLDIDRAHLTQTSATVNILSSIGAKLQLVYETKPTVMGAAEAAAAASPVTMSGFSVELLDAKGASNAALEAELLRYFDFKLCDDRTVEITGKAGADFSKIKSSYKLRLQLVKDTALDPITIGIPEVLTLKTVKKAPAIKAGAHKLNTFYDDQTIKLNLSSANGRITSVSAVPAPTKNPLPDWLTLNPDMSVTLNTANYNLYAQKPKSAKVDLAVTVEGYNPVPVTMTVTAARAAPGLKLSSTSVVMIGNAALSQGVALRLLPKNSKDTLASLKVTNLYLNNSDYEIKNYDPATGSFTLAVKSGGIPQAKTLDLRAEIAGTGQDVPLTLKTTLYSSTKIPAIKAAAKTLTLNTALGTGKDVATTYFTPTPADLKLDSLKNNIVIKQGKNGTPGALDIVLTADGRTVTVKTNGSTEPGKTYTVTLYTDETYDGPGGQEKSAEVSLTVKTLAEGKAGDVTASLSVKGKLNTVNPDSTVTLTTKLKNYNGKISSSAYTITAKDAKGNEIAGVSSWFTLNTNPDGSITVGFDKTNWEEGEIKPGYKYTITLPQSTAIEEATLAKPATVKLTAAQGSVKLTRSVKTVTLYKANPHSSAAVTIYAGGTPLPDSARVVLNNAAYSLLPLGGGRYAIQFNGYKPPASTKASTVKLTVYLAGNHEYGGNLGAKANGTVSVSVKLG